MKKNIDNLPDINRRINSIIDIKCGGNVRKFAMNMGLTDSSKINRLFNKNKQGDYPMPSTDIILLISNTYGYTTDWILKGETKEEKHVNNIDITRNSVKGNDNILGNGNTVTNVADLMDVIKQQQNQITNLIAVVTNGKV